MFIFILSFLFPKTIIGEGAVSAKKKEAQSKENRGGHYANRDWNVIDYDTYRLEGVSKWLRGPKPKDLKKGEYIACIGASQTFGVFCEKPYPLLLQERLKIETLNLGLGGVGPSFYYYKKDLR